MLSVRWETHSGLLRGSWPITLASASRPFGELLRLSRVSNPSFTILHRLNKESRGHDLRAMGLGEGQRQVCKRR